MSSSADAAIPKDVSMVIFPTPSLQLLAATYISKRNQKENYRQSYIDQILHFPVSVHRISISCKRFNSLKFF
jgi:hypothetical protein